LDFTQVNKSARGKLLRTKVKEAKKIGAAETKAKVAAEIKVKSKHILDEIKLRLAKSFDNLDLLELAAVLASTYVIHGIILTTKELFERVENISKGLQLISNTPDWVNFLPFIDTPLGWTANIPFLLNELWNILNESELDQKRKEEIVEGAKTILEKPQSDDLMLWAISFVIAYYVQKHGITNIFSSIQAFLGIKPV